MKINYLKKFKKNLLKFSIKKIKKTEEKIKLFQINPFEKSLNNHKLT